MRLHSLYCDVVLINSFPRKHHIIHTITIVLIQTFQSFIHDSSFYACTVTLEAPSSNVTVVSNGTGTHTVELQCEATGYIRPDSDIQWFREEEEMIIGEKYNVSFRDGRPNAAQTGHSNGTVPSRVSVLTIYEVDESDAGMYSCRSLDTGAVASLQLSMEMEPGISFNSTL